MVTICILYTSYMQMMSIASAFISGIALCKCWGFLKTFPIQYGQMNKKADCNGISYGWGFVYSFPRNCTLIICVLDRTFFVITCNICYLSRHHIFVFYYLCMFPRVILCHLRAEFLPCTFSRTTQLMWTVHHSFRWFA